MEEKIANGMEEATNERAAKSKTEYAKRIFSHSLVNGISAIIITKTKWRKFFKIFVLLFCTCGFFYQATEFIRFILTYPSVVDIRVYVPDEYVGPAYTACDNNGIKRSKFCAKYPQWCYTVENVTNFCSTYTEFCASLGDTSNITVVKPEFYDYETIVEFEELKELGSEELFKETVKFDVTGPIPVRKEDGVLILCYSAYLRVDSSKEPRRVKNPFRSVSNEIYQHTINIEPQEVFRPYREPGVYFNVHSPFSFESPIVHAFLLRPDRHCMFHLHMEEEDLLPYPYPSNCINYTDLWLQSGRRGPRSQDSCISRCLLTGALKYCGCSIPEILYPIEGPYCTSAEAPGTCTNESVLNELFAEFLECNKGCKDDCEKRKYKSSVQFRIIEDDPAIKRDKIRAKVTVHASDPEVVKYQLRPQYQDLEIFSYMGGFIGAWLGISLVEVVDLIESIIMIVINCFSKLRR